MITRPVALVTGASTGIGKAFAEELARRGNDLVLVARATAQLEEVARAVEQRHSVRTEVLTADLTLQGDVELVSARISSGNAVDIVINNAGRGNQGLFAESVLDDAFEQIDLNVRALVALSHAAVSAMVPRGAGSLLNVASIAAFQPLVKEAIYAASKAFVLTFTEALHEEVSRSGVKVTALCPGFTRSEFQARAGIDGHSLPRYAWQEADEVAVAGLDGLESNKAVVVPGTVNKLLGALTHVAPRSVVRSVSGGISSRFG
ncbi:MAG: SDR family NAD(P)-dependent oxidoreductase [Acidimicrobiales bacterium]